MFLRYQCVVWALACVSLSQSACGGRSNAPEEAAEATLSVSVAELALAARHPAALPTGIPGTPRVLTVTNTSPDITAQNVALDASVVLPAGTVVVGDCGTLAPLASCRFTLTPGAVATTAPVALPIRGSNTNTVAPTVQVLAYGSVYQGGYVFAIDDTTPSTGSVGGKVLAKRFNAFPLPWSLNSDPIPGVDERSVAPPCNGALDGACNTKAVVNHYDLFNVAASAYAVGWCSDLVEEGRDDWYLPAVCEMGVVENGSASGCGSRTNPTQQNVFTSLVLNGDVGQMAGGTYWTSTTANAAPAGEAWVQSFPAGGGGSLSHHDRLGRVTSTLLQRCARVIRY